MNIYPFGENSGSGTYDIGPQQFCGALVKSFNCSADFSSQAGALNVTLIDDETSGYRFYAPVVSQPTGFAIRTNDGSTIFEFNGIFDSIARNSDPRGGVTYSVSVSSPLKILGAVTVVTDTYTGYGRANEGLPANFSMDGFYNIPTSIDNYKPDGTTSIPSGSPYQIAPFSFGTNNENLNYTGMWANQYNIINAFGAFENDSVGIVNFKGFGVSASSQEGMTLDRVCYAIDELINRTGSSDEQRYLGGNILFGTNTYNICSTANGYTSPYPYYYGFDIIGFYNQVKNYVGPNYRVKGPITLLELVTQVCEEINADFLVNLDLVSYLTGDTTDYENLTHSVYSEGDFVLSQTYPNSILGGVIWVMVLPKNTYINCNRPFSDIAYNLISLERPDFGEYGTQSEIYPGIIPTGFLNPLDSSYTSVGTRASTPYGGTFPVGPSGGTGSSIITLLDRATNVNLSVKATDSTTSKMVVGNFQSRMVPVSRDYLYQYWGDIKIRNSGLMDCTSLNRSSDKSIPVVTQLLPPNDIVDHILVDAPDILPRNIDMWSPTYWEKYRFFAGNLPDPDFIPALQEQISRKENVAIIPFVSGVYSASVSEIRAAMQSYDEWEDFMVTIKPEKFKVIREFFNAYSNVINSVEEKKYNEIKIQDPYPVKIKEFKIKTQDPTASFTGAKNKLAVKTQIEEPDTVDSDLFLELLASKLKTIGDEHYGRSWYVPVPYFTTKVTENNDNLIGDYVRSWDLSDSAYVEPSMFYTIDAPFDSKFISDGKLLPYANYEYFATGESLGYDLFTNKITGFSPDGKAVYDFSEYSESTIVIDNTGCYPQPLVHTPIVEMDQKYKFLPCNYFNIYKRTSSPFFEVVAAGTIDDPQGVKRVNSVFGKTFVYSERATTGVMPAGALNSCGSSATLLNSTFSEPDRLTEMNTDDIMSDGHNGYYIQYPTTSNANTIRNIMNFRFSDNGLNALPFALVKTNRVFFPHANESGLAPNDSYFQLRLALLSNGYTNDEANFFINHTVASQTNSNVNTDFQLFPPVLPPASITIPQRSNRFVYGPWMTNYTILYCGKSEFEVNTDLSPENYIIPSYGSLVLSGGSFSSGINEQTSGFAGMNLAGQAIANSIDNFSLFAAEEGSMTLPGLPLISRIGENLLNGPRITDIQVSVDGADITTTYNFRQNSPRLNRTNRDIIKILSKISKTIKR